MTPSIPKYAHMSARTASRMVRHFDSARAAVERDEGGLHDKSDADELAGTRISSAEFGSPIETGVIPIP